jgi:hypothetical protein
MSGTGFITAARQSRGRGVIGARPGWDPQRPPGPSFRCAAVPRQGYLRCPALIPGSTGDLT